MKKKASISLAGILTLFVLIGIIKPGTDVSVPDTQVIESETVRVQAGETQTDATQMSSEEAASLAEAHINTALEAFANETIPEYSGNPYVELNGNVPYFTDEELSTTAFELYSELDSLGRCGACYANVCKEIMPTEERGSIGMVKPTGWHTVKYDCITDRYLYNRCHLIGYQLAGENANEKNLITGTRYLNVDGMLPFENEVADYVNDTDNHVLYRVTPVFSGDNLLASGVIIEAKSVEDNGAGVQFNVYCYNVQPGISIDYIDGQSWEDESSNTSESDNEETQATAVLQEQTATQSDTISSQQEQSAEQTDNAGGQEQPSVSETPAASGGDTMVWLSATGEKYHSINNCGRMNPDNATQVTEEYAINNGYGKCSKCW